MVKLKNFIAIAAVVALLAPAAALAQDSGVEGYAGDNNVVAGLEDTSGNGGGTQPSAADRRQRQLALHGLRPRRAGRRRRPSLGAWLRPEAPDPPALRDLAHRPQAQSGGCLTAPAALSFFPASGRAGHHPRESPMLRHRLIPRASSATASHSGS